MVAHDSGQERQVSREHRTAHRRYAILPLRSRWRRRGIEFSEDLKTAPQHPLFGRSASPALAERISISGFLIFGFALAVPDKAPTPPSLGRESVSVCSTLRDEWTVPRRCGRIAGCRAFNLPQGMRARLFARGLNFFRPNPAATG